MKSIANYFWHRYLETHKLRLKAPQAGGFGGLNLND